MAWPFWPSASVPEPTRSPPSVHLLEKKMLLAFFPLRNLQGFHGVCATIGTETDMHFCYLTITVQPRVSVSGFSHNMVPSAVKTLRVQDALKEHHCHLLNCFHVAGNSKFSSLHARHDHPA